MKIFLVLAVVISASFSTTFANEQSFSCSTLVASIVANLENQPKTAEEEAKETDPGYSFPPISYADFLKGLEEHLHSRFPVSLTLKSDFSSGVQQGPTDLFIDGLRINEARDNIDVIVGGFSSPFRIIPLTAFDRREFGYPILTTDMQAKDFRVVWQPLEDDVELWQDQVAGQYGRRNKFDLGGLVEKLFAVAGRTDRELSLKILPLFQHSVVIDGHADKDLADVPPTVSIQGTIEYFYRDASGDLLLVFRDSKTLNQNYLPLSYIDPKGLTISPRPNGDETSTLPAE